MVKKIKICCISDTHTQHRQLEIPECDLLIHAGDILGRDETHVLLDFNDWIGELKDAGTIKEAVVTSGNHDMILDKDSPFWFVPGLKEQLTNFIYLEHEHVEVMGLKIFGSPYSAQFYNWAFMYERGPDADALWDQIDDDVNIIIVHGPPAGIADALPPDWHVNNPDEITDWDSLETVGCYHLADQLKRMSELKLGVFGHIHFSYGCYDKDGNRTKDITKTKYIGASSCTEAYKPTNPPIVIDV